MPATLKTNLTKITVSVMHSPSSKSSSMASSSSFENEAVDKKSKVSRSNPCNDESQCSLGNSNAKNKEIQFSNLFPYF